MYSPRRRSGIWRKNDTYSRSYVVSSRFRIRDVWGLNIALEADYTTGAVHAILK